LPGLVTTAAALPAAIIAIPSKGLDAGHKGGIGRKAAADSVAAAPAGFGKKPSHQVTQHASTSIEAFTASFGQYRIISGSIRSILSASRAKPEGVMTMVQYAMDKKTVSEAVNGGGLLIVAQWEASEGQADRVAGILDRFLPEAQREPGAKLFLISRAKENPAQFLFYELFRDEAAFKAHQESAHFKTYIAGEALPLLAKRERTQYALL
jgi:quinol monooxygenase YgiN